jgi:hypothetical protein
MHSFEAEVGATDFAQGLVKLDGGRSGLRCGQGSKRCVGNLVTGKKKCDESDAMCQGLVLVLLRL